MVYHNKDSLKSRNEKVKKQRRNRREDAVTDHHIIPLSRNGPDVKENKTDITVYFHDRYHELFGNMTPSEILAFLETYFWKNQKKWIDEYSFYRQKDSIF